MKIIDVHTHLPIGPGGEDARAHAAGHGIDCSLKGYLRELNQAGVSKAILISWPTRPTENALIECEHVLKYAAESSFLLPVCALNPLKFKKKRYQS